MARRRHSSFASLLAVAALVLSACAAGNADLTTMSSTISTTLPPTTTLAATTTSTTTTLASTTTSTTLPPTTTTTLVELPPLDAEIKIPNGVGPFPAVVLVHGGGWVTGDTGLMRGLANHLTDAGFLTVNIRYTLSNESPGFPDAVEDVACAVNHARALPDSDGTVAVIGHSAGAHISAVTALTGDQYAQECPVPGSGVPDRFVGLAGPYDVARLGLLMLPFFGAGPNAAPDEWLAGNPQQLTDENTDLVSLIMYGDRDGIVDDSFASEFHQALVNSGSESVIERVEGARHMNVRQPEWVGDLIVVWLER